MRPSIIDCCYKCVEDRYPGCQDHCERYAKQKAKHEARKAELARKHKIDDYVMNSNAKRANAHAINKKNRRGYNDFHK